MHQQASPTQLSSTIPEGGYKSLAEQFNTHVIISTFTATLIVAILSFVHDTLDTSSSGTSLAKLCFHVGTFLSMCTIGLHFGIIVVSGRARSLCFRLGFGRHDPVTDHGGEDPEAGYSFYKDVDFYRFLRYCENVHFFATILLVSSILLMTFSVFVEKAFSFVFIVVVSLIGISIWRTGFWRISTGIGLFEGLGLARIVRQAVKVRQAVAGNRTP